MALDIPESSEVWKSIPPEEKLELMSKAHAAGILACLIAVIVLSTIAVGLKQSWLIWGSFLATPFIFQFSSGKRWRGLKPRVMLEYLAARSASRRFAYTTGSRDMRLLFLFRGYLEVMFDTAHLSDEIEARLEDRKETPVWVALFQDCLIMLSERSGGAELEFGFAINDRMKLEGKSPPGETEYSNKRELYFTCIDRDKEEKKFRLTSQFPGALVVFEKKVLQNMQQNTSRSLIAATPQKGFFDEE